MIQEYVRDVDDAKPSQITMMKCARNKNKPEKTFVLIEQQRLFYKALNDLADHDGCDCIT
ncbi:hypothetical protein KIN20_020795 [Parelaphostrongylus tenuis]|uniref:Uncharacterized protein n=1 Tax=Parelaphostrongylus tenuis TaxID=148309 RepID=A0AAD5N4I3_PARTN|nr:hypothetical protein KIN20_020795 [Parelaphostrongylus tenuis]